MRKNFTVSLFALLIIGSERLSATNYYFSSSTGNDTYTTAQAQNPATPWKSLAKLNSFFSSLQPGDSVLFKRGDIFLGSITPSRSGTSTAPIILAAYGSGNNPVISGATVLSSWTAVSGGIYETALATEPRVVTINNQQYAPGRYPNTGWLNIDATGGTNITSSGLSGQTGLTGADVVIRMNRFIIEKCPITSQSGNNINFTGNAYTAEPNWGFFITNKQSTLDQYGEWFYDNAAGKLRVFFGAAGPTSVSVSTVDEILNVDTKSYLKFLGLDFQHGNQYTVKVTNTDNLTFDGCGWKWCGITGLLSWGNGNTNLTLRNNNLSYINSDGFKIYGGVSNNNLLIESNNFNNIGIYPGEGGVNEYRAIALENANSSNATIRYNTINNTGYCGISVGGGTNLLVKNNYITNFCFLMDDGGGIYIQDATNTPNKRLTGNILLYGGQGAGEGTPDPSSNQAYGIYSDAFNSFTEVDNNTIAYCGQGGIYMDDSRDMNFHHNVCYDNVKGITIEYFDRAPISNLRVIGNKVVNKDLSSAAFCIQRLVCNGLPVTSWGTIDSNYWCRPLNDNNTIYYNTCSNSGLYTLNGWQSSSGYDAHAHKSPIPVTTAAMIRFEYNETNTPKVIPLGAVYMALDGTIFSGSLTLAPYTSTILLLSSGTPPNQPPTANAGTDKTITLPTNSITQTGGGSDPDGVIATFQWAKVAGPTTYTIVSPSQAQTTINNLVQGVYQFELTVTDNAGATGKDTMTVTVNAAPPNQAPTANAGTDKTITLPTNTITQAGSGNDPDGSIASYQWTKISGPTTFTIVSPTSATTVINNLVQGVYQFELKVTDNQGATGKDTMVVTVNPANLPPTANAGADKTIQLPTNTITQAGSGNDPDGSIASYQWTKISGPTTFTIVSPTSATTVINNLVQGVYQFELKVTDNQGATGKDTMVVTVNPANLPPTANAGADKTIQLPINTITQAGSGNDPDGSIASYQWTKISGPTTFTIVSPTSATTVINNLVQGVYQFELKVTDNQGATGKDTMVVTVNPVNQPPTANAGTDKTIALPTTSITQAGSGTDPDGSIVSYQWAKIAGPAQFVIISPASATTVINNLVQGNYQFELTVTDNQGATGKDTMNLVVNAAPPNQPPTANAGADKTITLPTNTITQTGTGNDPDGSITAYQWTKISGPATYTIVSPTSATTVINNLVQGVYQFELMVTDNQGATGKDTMVVTVNAAPANQPPTANAGADKTITLPTNTITQTGTGTDPDGSITAYQWTKISGPATYTIVSPTSATTVINNLVQGVYQFELMVTDNQGATGKDTMVVTVNAAPANQPPTANAGADKTITLPTNTITQTGTGSDPDGSITAYQWTKISGPASFTIVSPTSATTVINNLVQGVYQFELMVTDNQGATGKDTMVVTVNAAPANQPPTANAGADKTITLPTNTITQTGTGNDPDGSITAYQWTKISGPATYTIVSPTSATTVINNLVQGVYQFELMVTDNQGATGKDTMVVTVNAAPANQPPTANAGADKTITLPINTITQTGTGNDPDGSITAYQWTKISGPATYTIVSPTSATTVINNLVQGVYQFELKVTDNQGATGKDTMVVTVNAAAPPPNLPPTANAGADTSIVLPVNSVQLNGSGNDADGNIVSYQWVQLSGPASALLTPATQAQATAANLVNGTYVFQLTVTDNAGATGKDTVVIRVDNPAQSTAILFPNPANNNINVRITAATTANKTMLQIITVNGNIVYQTELMRSTSTIVIPVDISRFANGSYFMKISLDINNWITLPFVKH